MDFAIMVLRVVAVAAAVYIVGRAMGSRRNGAEGCMHALGVSRSLVFVSALALVAGGMVAALAATPQSSSEAAVFNVSQADQGLQTTEERKKPLLAVIEKCIDADGRDISIITTPRYTLTVPNRLFSEGFTWEYHDFGADCAPKGATGVTVLTDGASGAVSHIAYCYDALCGTMDPGVVEGFDVYDGGRSRGDFKTGLALAVASGSSFSGGVNPLIGSVLGTSPCFTGGGASNAVYGLDDRGLARGAYLAEAVFENDCIRIITPHYVVVIPAEWAGLGLNASYVDDVPLEMLMRYDSRVETHSLTVAVDEGPVATVFCCRPEYVNEEEVTGIYTCEGLMVCMRGQIDDMTVRVNAM